MIDHGGAANGTVEDGVIEAWFGLRDGVNVDLIAHSAAFNHGENYRGSTSLVAPTTV